MTSFDHLDGFSMVSALVYLVTHLIGHTMNYDITYRVVMITKLLNYIDS